MLTITVNGKELVEPDGIEPTTSCLQSRRSLAGYGPFCVNAPWDVLADRQTRPSYLPMRGPGQPFLFQKWFFGAVTSIQQNLPQ